MARVADDEAERWSEPADMPEDTEVVDETPFVHTPLDRRLPSLPIANIFMWMVIEAVVLWFARGLVLTLLGHDIWDMDNNLNRILSLAIIVLSFAWLFSKLSVTGLTSLSVNYSRRLTGARMEHAARVEARSRADLQRLRARRRL